MSRSKFTPAVFSRILLSLRIGMPIDKAAVAAGIRPNTLRTWMSENEDIAMQVFEAETSCESELLGVLDTAVHGQDARLAVQTAEWMLERLNPAAWGRTNRNDQYQRERQVKELAQQLEGELGLPAPEIEAQLHQELSEMERKKAT